jgi:hypothetical protein
MTSPEIRILQHKHPSTELFSEDLQVQLSDPRMYLLYTLCYTYLVLQALRLPHHHGRRFGQLIPSKQAIVDES